MNSNQMELRIAFLEAEIARRDKAAGEPVAWQVCAAVFTNKENATRWAIAERHDIVPLYTAQPAALPPEVTEPVGEWCRRYHCEGVAWMAGANWMREQVKALGVQPEKVVVCPPTKMESVFSGVALVGKIPDEQANRRDKQWLAALDAAGVKWKEAE